MKRNKLKHILFVCTGNTCRSVIAEAFFRKIIKSNKLDYLTDSAGVSVFSQKEPLCVREVLKDYGLDFENRSAQPLTQSLIDRASFIFTMTDSQKKQVETDFVRWQDKLWLLSSFACGKAVNIRDPLGSGLDTYSDCAKQIKDLVEKTAEKLIWQEKNAR